MRRAVWSGGGEPGELQSVRQWQAAGVSNGDPSSHESDKGDKRRAFNGLAMAIVQAGKQAGEMRVEASAPGWKALRRWWRARRQKPGRQWRR